MIVPKPKKLASGYAVYLRLGGEKVTAHGMTAKEATREAQRIKAEYLAGERAKINPAASCTVSEAMENYISSRRSVLSPSTLRGYTIIKGHRFTSIASRRLSDIRPSEWQAIVDAEARACSEKTLKNAWGFLRSAAEAEGVSLPKVTLPAGPPPEFRFLTVKQIGTFIDAVKDTPHAVPFLLGLSSLRISEIYALRWEDIPDPADHITVRGAVVPDENHKYVSKGTNKTKGSTRIIPVFIPELRAAIERDRKPSGPIVTVSQKTLRLVLERICEEAGLPRVTPHDLRRSFASAAYSAKVPERITMEIGGWSDYTTMHKVYIQIAKQDIDRYTDVLTGIFGGNANENANTG